MTFLRSILFSSCVLFGFNSFASDALTAQFKTEFYSQYSAGMCGTNIMNLAERAAARGIDISHAHILEIKNLGSSVFGLVRADFARGGGDLYPTPQPHGIRWLPGGKNWEFHSVLENDGLIYDFDFGNEPTVLPAREYFASMFLRPSPFDVRHMFHVTANQKLDEYQVSVINASDVVANRNPPRETKMSLRAYLEKH